MSAQTDAACENWRVFLFTSSQVRARLVMQDPSADCPCQEKMPSSWLQVMTVPPGVATTRITSPYSPQCGALYVLRAKVAGINLRPAIRMFSRKPSETELHCSSHDGQHGTEEADEPQQQQQQQQVCVCACALGKAHEWRVSTRVGPPQNMDYPRLRWP